MIVERSDWKTKADVWAECQDCGWQSRAANAWGIGVQHSRRNAHEVRIEVDRDYYYGSPSRPSATEPATKKKGD